MSSQPPVTPVQNTPTPEAAARLPRLQIQLAVVITILVVVMIFILDVATFLVYQQNVRQGFGERVRDLAGVVATQVDGNLHATLVLNDQQFSADYNKIRGELVRAVRAAPEIASIFTLRKVGEDIVYVVDSDPVPAGVQEVYASVPAFARSLFDTITAPVAGDSFFTDEYGTFQSGYAPIYNAQGALEALLVVDIDAEVVLSRERTILLTLALASLPLVLATAGLSLLYGRSLARSIEQISAAAQRYTTGDLNQRIQPRRGWSREAHDLGTTFNTVADNLANLLSTLEARVGARTQEAERRTEYVQAASEVAAATSSIMDSERLIRQVVELIRDRFKLYYVGLFLVDDSGEWAVLRSGTGDAGQRMMARGHRIQVGQGMIGWSIANAQPRISLEAGEDIVRLAASELPLTRSEAAIPLRSRERVLGALTVQSTESNAFDQSLLLTFQTMADQVAVALDNARLLHEGQAALEAAQRSYQQITQRGWQEFLQGANTTRVYRADALGVAPASLEALADEAGLADGPGRQVVLPVKVRGQDLGRIVANKPANHGDWRSDEVTLMRDIVEQISVALENARLYSETQRSVERERILSDITAVVRSSTSVDAILQNAVRQLASALNVPQAAIRLYTGEAERLAEPEEPGREPVQMAEPQAVETAEPSQEELDKGQPAEEMPEPEPGAPEDEITTPEPEPGLPERAPAAASNNEKPAE